jgi:translocation and assembly module TamB
MTAGPGISATARSSASRLLSQQLNRLSDRYIRGVELSFEVESYEDYADGQMVGRTELQMEISRKFLDERLRITAGGNLELEDETRRQLHPSDIAGDFSVEYLITPDGRLIVKVYRERNFQDVFDGEVVETGLALIFRQTYNRFRELFRRKE